MAIGRKPDPKGEVVGYWKTYGTLTHVIVRNAGHMVPHDQPAVSQASFLNVTHAWFCRCAPRVTPPQPDLQTQRVLLMHKTGFC